MPISRNRTKTEPGKQRVVAVLGKGYSQVKKSKRGEFYTQPVNCDHFVFKPGLKNEKHNDVLMELFEQCYGKQPKRIDDIRFPHSAAGNFDMGKTTWLRAEIYQKHGNDGRRRAILIAEADEDFIYRLRNAETGRVDRLDEPIPRDPKGVMYKGKLVEWKPSCFFNIQLPELNDAIFEWNSRKENRLNRLPLGVVQFITHAWNEVEELGREFYGGIDLVMSAAQRASGAGHAYNRDYLDLTIIPFSIYREMETISTPNYVTKDRGDRLFKEEAVVHLELQPSFQYELMKQSRIAGQQMLVASNVALLQTGNPVDNANSIFFDDAPAISVQEVVGGDDGLEVDETGMVIDGDVVVDGDAVGGIEDNEWNGSISNEQELIAALASTVVYEHVGHVKTTLRNCGYRITGDWVKDFNAIMSLATDEELPF